MKLTKKLLLLLALPCALPVMAQKSLPKLGKSSVSQVVRAMTLDEKAHLLVGVKSKEGLDIIANGAGLTYAIPRLGVPHTIMMDGATRLSGAMARHTMPPDFPLRPCRPLPGTPTWCVR